MTTGQEQSLTVSFDNVRCIREEAIPEDRTAGLLGANDTEKKFIEFHRENPAVYALIVKLAREAKRRGKTKCAIDMIHAVCRWDFWLNTTSDDEYKLNNNHRPYYARLIMKQEPDLTDFFDLRELHSPSEIDSLPDGPRMAILCVGPGGKERLVPMDAVCEHSEVVRPNDFGVLIVKRLWAEAVGITKRRSVAEMENQR